jgi:hypothetical protein
MNTIHFIRTYGELRSFCGRTAGAMTTEYPQVTCSGCQRLAAHWHRTEPFAALDTAFEPDTTDSN